MVLEIVKVDWANKVDSRERLECGLPYGLLPTLTDIHNGESLTIIIMDNNSLTTEELNYIKDLQSKADAEVANPNSNYFEPDESRRRTAARSLMQSWEEQKAEAAETIRQLGPLKVLQSGLAEGRITQAEFDEHQSLAQSLAQHPSNHKRMTEIVFKALG